MHLGQDFSRLNPHTADLPEGSCPSEEGAGCRVDRSGRLRTGKLPQLRAFPLSRKPHTVITLKKPPGKPVVGATLVVACPLALAPYSDTEPAPCPDTGAGIQVRGGARPFHVSQLWKGPASYHTAP